jgi:hypothetical protein
VIGRLDLGVAACALWALGGLAFQVIAARSHGRRARFAVPARPAWRGVAYALGAGLSPGAKESVREHRGVWLAGVAYHAGILAGLAVLAAAPRGSAAEFPGLRVAGALGVAGALAGGGLLVRRITRPVLRAISHPDDFLANALATSFAALAFARTVTPAAEPAFLAAAMLLFLYVPLGKIRHCAFFFLSRIHAGALFGRRGVLPPAA